MKFIGNIVLITGKDLQKLEETSLIAVSNDLIIGAQWPKLTLDEQRLILYMLGLIDKWDDDLKVFKISVKELANVFGVRTKRIYELCDKATDGLMTKLIKFVDPIENERVKVTWCAETRESQEKGYVKLVLSPGLKPFLLALKGRFTSWELRAVINLKNHYSLRIYQILKVYKGLKQDTFEVDLTWFKQKYLDATSKTYNNFNDFKRRILIPAQKDIAAKTDILFTFKADKKKTRKVQSIIFSVEDNPNFKQLPIFQKPEPEKFVFENELPPGWSDDKISTRLKGYGFKGLEKARKQHENLTWLDVFTDLDFHIEKGTKIANKGGWIRSMLPEPGEPYVFSPMFKKEKERIIKKEKAAGELKKDKQENEKRARKFGVLLYEKVQELKEAGEWEDGFLLRAQEKQKKYLKERYTERMGRGEAVRSVAVFYFNEEFQRLESLGVSINAIRFCLNKSV